LDDIEEQVLEIIVMLITGIFAEEEMILLEESGSKGLNALWDKVGIGAGKNRKEIIAVG